MRRLTSRTRAPLILALTLLAAGLVGLGLTTSSSTALADEPSTTESSAPDAAEGGVPPGGVIPSSGPADSYDPNAVKMFVDQTGCLSCHGNPSLTGLMTKTRPDGSTIALYVDTQASANSVHRYKDCTECHGANPHDESSPLTKLSLSAKCGSCHAYEYDQWKESVHGAPQFTGNSDPATCTDCHSATGNPHNVVRVLDPLATTYPKNIADTCGKCHDDPSLMNKYGIVEKVYESYMRSFHGKAMKLSPANSGVRQLDTATCVNCHGSHNISSTSDPAAPVAGMDNLIDTCKTCHPDAGPEFVTGFVGHKAVNSDYLPEVYWGGKSFYILSRAMLAGGLLIVAGSISIRTVSWTTKLFRRPRRKKKDEEEE